MKKNNNGNGAVDYEKKYRSEEVVRIAESGLFTIILTQDLTEQLFGLMEKIKNVSGSTCLIIFKNLKKERSELKEKIKTYAKGRNFVLFCGNKQGWYRRIDISRLK